MVAFEINASNAASKNGGIAKTIVEQNVEWLFVQLFPISYWPVGSI